MRKSSVITVAIVFLGLALVGCSLPHQSEQKIRAQLFRETPNGTMYSAVLDHVKKQGWRMIEEGAVYDTNKTAMFPTRVKGSRVIIASLGEYRGMPWVIDVVCYWGFDEQGRLVDIYVEKEEETL